MANSIEQQLTALTLAGASAEVTSVLAEYANVKFADADERRWVLGPLVVHQSAWMDTIPTWAKPQAFAERWLIVAGQLSDHVVGPTEIMCVIMPATYDGPLRSEAADVYLWAARHAIVKHFGVDSLSAKTAYEISAHVRDADVLQPGGRLYHNYRQLAFEIRSRVARACQMRTREAKRQKKEIAQPEPAEQISLFEKGDHQ